MVQVSAMFRAGDIRRNVLALYGEAMFVSLSGGTNMAAGSGQKHMSSSFAIKSQ